jgi:hypothetical protein
VTKKSVSPAKNAVTSEAAAAPTEAQAAAKSSKVSAASKVKKPAKKAAKKKRPGKRKSAAPTTEINKSEEIRQQFKTLGKKARPKDVVAALAAKGIKVAPAQVSVIRTKLIGKSKMKKANASSATRSVSVADLEAAKKVADKLGGIDAVRTALEVLARLR